MELGLLANSHVGPCKGSSYSVKLLRAAAPASSTAPLSETLSATNTQRSCSQIPDPQKMCEMINVTCFKLLSSRVCSHR